MKEMRKYDSTERGKERSKQKANGFEAPQFRLDVDVFENRAQYPLSRCNQSDWIVTSAEISSAERSAPPNAPPCIV
jgi:hypothetical protein